MDDDRSEDILSDTTTPLIEEIGGIEVNVLAMVKFS
jgi:hypothetical protein